MPRDVMGNHMGALGQSLGQANEQYSSYLQLALASQAMANPSTTTKTKEDELIILLTEEE